jgi:DNA-binding NarL/FixJ family response regulator
MASIRVVLVDQHPCVLPQQSGLHLLQNLSSAQVGACHREHREKRDEATMTSSNLSVNSVRSVAHPRTLIFSDRADAPTVEQALAYGVDAYLTKDATAETLFAALRIACAASGTGSARPSSRTWRACDMHRRPRRQTIAR